MTVAIRPAHAGELEHAQALVVASINDLTVRHGFGPMAGVRPPAFQLLCLDDDPRGLWVAEDGGRMVGYAMSWVCDSLWFLAELFVTTDQQGRGTGRELLARTLEHAQSAGATNKALITFTFNRVSQALYIKNGLFPRTPVYMLSAPREKVRMKSVAVPLRPVPIEETSAHIAELARIDRHALSINREKHHRFLLRDGAMRGVLLYDSEDCVGYAYVNTGGHIGPFATTEFRATGPAFRTALKLAVDQGAAGASAFIPGANEAALGIAVETGMKIDFPMLLMSSRPFGDWSQYLPRNPGFM